MRILLDTNVVLDLLLMRKPAIEAADGIFRLIYQNKVLAAVTANTLTDIYYIVAKSLGDPAAREALEHLLNTLEVIGVDGDDCAFALGLPMKDFEDAVVMVCGHKDNVDYIVTGDTEFLAAELRLTPVISPADFLVRFSADFA